jgi:hypothetical protein
MRTARILVVLVAVLAAAWVAIRPGRRTPAPPPEQRAPAARGATRPGVSQKLALLVGIDHCQEGTPFPALAGCVADIHAARELLETRFGFAHEDVLELVDEAATHASIVRAWREFLIARAGPGTEAVFWFAGHGSQVPDASGKDSSGTGCDQTLIAWDSRAHGEDGAYDLTDDELYVLDRELSRKGAQLLSVTDACHSATVMRGPPGVDALRVRGADAGRRKLERTRIDPFWNGLDWIDDGDPRRTELPGSVQISACAAEQNAYERIWIDASGSARAYGVLDYFLLQELRLAQPGESCRAVLERAAGDVRAAALRQDPSCEAGGDRPLFGGAFAPAPRGFRARIAEGGLLVEAGDLLGLVQGSVLAVEDGTGHALSEPARVESCTQLQSRARWAGTAAVAPGAELIAREVRRACGSRKLKLSADAQTLDALPEEARRQMLELAVLVPAGPASELVLSAEPAQGGLVLRDSEGVLLWREQAERAQSGARFELASVLRRELVEELVYRALLAVPACPRIEIEARFLPLQAADWERALEELKKPPHFDTQLHPRPELAGAVWSLRAGDESSHALVKLELENPGDRPLWFNVVSVCEDRSRNLVTADELPLQIAPHQRDSILIRVLFPPDIGLERALLDHYLVIAMPERRDLRALKHTEVLRGGESPVPMPEILESARLSVVERGSSHEPVRVDPQDYGIRLLELLIESAR